jgi:hypothetical protein
MAVDLVWFDSEEDRADAVNKLRQMNASARKMLAQAVESSGITRKKASDSALMLESAGFVIIREIGFMGEDVKITPTLWGEEVLEVVDDEDKHK